MMRILFYINSFFRYFTKFACWCPFQRILFVLTYKRQYISRQSSTLSLFLFCLNNRYQTHTVVDCIDKITRAMELIGIAWSQIFIRSLLKYNIWYRWHFRKAMDLPKLVKTGVLTTGGQPFQKIWGRRLVEEMKQTNHC